MGDFDTDNDMMRDQQARDTHGHSRDPNNMRQDIDEKSGIDRRAAQLGEGASKADVLAENKAGLTERVAEKIRKSGVWPPLASKGRSLLGD